MSRGGALRGGVAVFVAATLALTSVAAAAPGSSGIEAPSRGSGGTVARIVVPVEARSAPGSGREVWHVGTATGWTGQPQVLLVLGSAAVGGREWLRVLLPIRPVGASGWIPRDDVVLGSTPYWVTVDRSARTVTVYRRGRRVRVARAVVGKHSTPTPAGLAAIYERDRQPNPREFLGPWALPLTALSNVLYNFGGGPGRVAIHGRGGASLLDPLGSARSHGCIRIDNGPVTWMARHLPVGTPVQIEG
ncbi:MAG: L,D-transpeptidase family protein [Solirubrobacterales bacterium]